MRIISQGHTDDAEITTVLESGRPGHVLVIVEGATEGYYTEAFHRKITKEEQAILDKENGLWKKLKRTIMRNK